MEIGEGFLSSKPFNCLEALISESWEPMEARSGKSLRRSIRKIISGLFGVHPKGSEYYTSTAEIAKGAPAQDMPFAYSNKKIMIHEEPDNQLPRLRLTNAIGITENVPPEVTENVPPEVTENVPPEVTRNVKVKFVEYVQVQITEEDKIQFTEEVQDLINQDNDKTIALIIAEDEAAKSKAELENARKDYEDLQAKCEAAMTRMLKAETTKCSAADRATAVNFEAEEVQKKLKNTLSVTITHFQQEESQLRVEVVKKVGELRKLLAHISQLTNESSNAKDAIENANAHFRAALKKIEYIKNALRLKIQEMRQLDAIGSAFFEQFSVRNPGQERYMKHCCIVAPNIQEFSKNELQGEIDHLKDIEFVKEEKNYFSKLRGLEGLAQNHSEIISVLKTKESEKINLQAEIEKLGESADEVNKKIAKHTEVMENCQFDQGSIEPATPEEIASTSSLV